MIHPGEKVQVPGSDRNKQASAPPAPTPTPGQVKQDLTKKVQQASASPVKPPTAPPAPGTPGAGASQSGAKDPVSAAAQALKQEHKDDAAYLKVLDQVEPGVRSDYTKNRVRQHLTHGDIDGGLKVLKTNMDATNSPAERQALYQAAGKPNFTQQLFEGRFQQVIAQSPQKNSVRNRFAGMDAVGQQLSAWKAMPPEVAGTALNTVKTSLPELKGTFSRAPTSVVGSAPVDSTFYGGLSQTVEQANAPFVQQDHAKEMAQWLIGNPSSSTAMRGRLSMQQTVRSAVGEGAGAQLSAAMINALPNASDSKFQGMTTRSRALQGLAKGMGDLQQKTSDATAQWDKQSGAVRFMLRNFQDPDHPAPGNSQSPGRVDDAVTAYQNKHPDKVTAMNKALGEAGDAGATLFQATQAVQGLHFDPNKARASEKDVLDALHKIDGDHASLWAISQSQALRRQFAAQVAFETLPDGSALTVDKVNTQVQRVDHVLPTLGLPKAVKDQIQLATTQWASDAKQALGNNAPAQALTAQTQRYRAAVRQALTSQPANLADKLLEPVIPAGPPIAGQHGMDQAGWWAYASRSLRGLYFTSGELGSRALLQKAAKEMQRAVLNGKPVTVALTKTMDRVRSKQAQQWFWGNSQQTINAAIDRTWSYYADLQKATEAAPDGKLSASEFKRIDRRYRKDLDGVLRAGAGSMDLSDGHLRLWTTLRGFGLATYITGMVSDSKVFAEGRQSPSTYAFMGLYVGGAISETGQLVQSLRNYNPRGPAAVLKLTQDLRLWMVADQSLSMFGFGGGILYLGEAIKVGDPWQMGFSGALIAGDAISMLSTYLPLEAASGPVGWIGGAITSVALVGLAGYNQFERVQESNEFEWGNPAIREMARSMGFSDAQGKALFNQNQNGVSPMRALNQLANSKGNSTRQMITYLQGLTPEQIHNLVLETHHLMNTQMDDKGYLRKTASEQVDRDAGKKVTRDVKAPVRPLVGPPNRDPLVPPLKKTGTETVIPHAKSLRGLGNWMKNQGMAFNPPHDPSQATQLPAQQPSAQQPSAPKPKPKPYVVKPGDNLWTVAWQQSNAETRASALAQAGGNTAKAHSIVLHELLKANPVFDPKGIG